MVSTQEIETTKSVDSDDESLHGVHVECQWDSPFVTAVCGRVLNWDEMDEESTDQPCIMCYQGGQRCPNCGALMSGGILKGQNRTWGHRNKTQNSNKRNCRIINYAAISVKRKVVSHARVCAQVSVCRADATNPSGVARLLQWRNVARLLQWCNVARLLQWGRARVVARLLQWDAYYITRVRVRVRVIRHRFFIVNSLKLVGNHSQLKNLWLFC